MTSTESAEASTRTQLPYLSFGSLRNLLDRLRTAGSVPGRIDRPFLGGSGAYQSQMLQALKFFGLVEADLSPTPALRALALADDEARKGLMAEIVRERYSALLALGEHATQSQLEEAIRGTGLSGDTVRKAASLFLTAAKFSDVPVSAWFKVGKPTTTANGNKRKATRRTKVETNGGGEDEDTEEEVPPPRTPGAAGSTTIRLASGGHLTFAYSVDLFAMSSADRTFVFKLIDEMQAYEASLPPRATTSPAPGESGGDDDEDAGE